MKDNAKPASTRVVLHGVRLAYADQLITPKAFEEGQQPKYGCTILLPPNHPGIVQVEAALEAAAAARWGRKEEWPRLLKGITRDPAVKDVADYPKIGIEDAGWCFIRASSLDPPGIVDNNVSALNPADLRRECYSGRWATVSVNAYAYDRHTGAGVSLGLGNIQLLKHDTRLGVPRPKPGEEFEPEDLPDPDNDDFAPPRRRSARRR
jgi:hypothetical protein